MFFADWTSACSPSSCLNLPGRQSLESQCALREGCMSPVWWTCEFPGFAEPRELTSSIPEEFVRLVLYLYLLRGYSLQNLNHFACLELLPTFCRRGNISQWTFYPFYLFWYFLSKQFVALSSILFMHFGSVKPWNRVYVNEHIFRFHALRLI